MALNRLLSEHLPGKEIEAEEGSSLYKFSWDHFNIMDG